MSCPACGAEAPEGARFCPGCGHDLASRGDERRVVTILFADIVGFTSLSETMDPEQVKNLVDGCFEQMVGEITAFGGVVDKIIGDAVVALFGAPTAHEDDAERAVRAALQMQDVMAARRTELGIDVHMRIGVNTGEVLVGALRAGGDYTAMGDVVNTAQRLESSAAPDSVLVGRSTWIATRGVIEYESSVQLSAKGKEDPVDAWVARAPVLPPGYRHRKHTPLIGRHGEFGMLENALETALARNRAHLILLLGEAGVGKSRLAEELAGVARCDHDAVVLEGRCVPYGEANVWWPVAEAIRQATGIEATDDAATAEACIVDAVTATMDDPTAAEVEVILQGLLHLLGYDGPLRNTDAARARQETVHALLGYVEAAARSRPLVLVLSDLHWADDVVLELVDDVLERLGRGRVVVVATARQELTDRWSARVGRHNSLTLNVDPLERGDADQLLDHLVEGDLSADARGLILDRSSGNPFFLEELVALVADGSSNAVTPPVGAVGELPDTLRGLLAARLDSLTGDERRTLEEAAVWGPNGPVKALQRISETRRGTDDIDAVLGTLVEKDLITADLGEWSFRSDLVREIAYNTVTKAERASLHYGIAHYLATIEYGRLEPTEADEHLVDTVAHHFASAGRLVHELGPVRQVGDDVIEQAVEWLSEAARRAEIAHLYPVSVRHASQALELVEPEDGRKRFRLLLSRARARSELRLLDEALVDLDEAERLADAAEDEGGLAKVALARGELQQRGGDLVESLATLDEAVDRFSRVDDQRGMAETLRAIGMTNLFRSDNVAAESAISRALDLSRGLDDRRGEAWALQQLAWISFVSGRAGEAESRLQTAVATFEDLGDGGGLTWAKGLLAYVMFQQGRLDEAGTLGDSILLEARTRGDAWGEGMMSVLGANVRLWSGRASQAVERAESALAVFRSINDGFGEINAQAVLGRALVSSGRVDDGFTVLGEGAGVTRGSEDAATEIGRTALASAAVQVGDPHRMSAATDGFLDPEAHSGSVANVERRVAAGLAALQSGRLDEALRHLEAAVTGEDESLPNAYALSGLALARAANGEVDPVFELDQQVSDMNQATYLDRGTSKLAAILVRARRGDADAASRFEAVVRAADTTEDLVAQAISRLTQAYGLEALGAPDAAGIRREAETRLTELGLEAPGWRNAVELVLTAEPREGRRRRRARPGATR